MIAPMAAMAENAQPSPSGTPTAEGAIAGGETLSDKSITPPQAVLFDDFGRSAVCLDFSSGAFTWEILQGPGAGNFYSGTGLVLHTYGPWQLVYTTPWMTMTAVYVQNNPHGAGGLWVSGGGGQGTKGGSPGVSSITSAVYDTGQVQDRQPICGGDDAGAIQPAPQLPSTETPAGDQAVSETSTIPPTVNLFDDFGRSSVCLDFSTGSFTWNILQGYGAGIGFGGIGTVLHTVGPWQILYFGPYATMTAVYVQDVPHGAGPCGFRAASAQAGRSFTRARSP